MAELGTVRNNESAQRFELEVDGDVAFAAYRLSGDTMDIVHTVTPPAHRGRGVGSALARGALDIARERGLKVIPTCWFIADFIRANPEYRDLLDDRARHGI